MAADKKSLVLRCSSCQSELPDGTDVCPSHGHKLELLEDKLIGMTIGEHYEIIERIGKGGMGVVYKAHHKYMDTFVAVKILYKEYSSDQGAINRFTQEARMLANLKHPNILSITDFGMTEENEPYLVMEYLQGTSLEDYLEKNGTMPVEEALTIFIQSCDGLAEAHEKGVIHRDLKPGNLMLISDPKSKERVKLLDFGIAKMKGSEGKGQQKLTQDGEIYGSPLYMSPEQCEGRELDERSDIYSFGCVMYETLTGMPPLMGANSFETMTKHVRELPLPLRGAAPNLVIPDLVDFVILKSLAKSAGKRQQSALELKSQLAIARSESNVHISAGNDVYSPSNGSDSQPLPGVLPDSGELPRRRPDDTSGGASADQEKQELERLMKEAQTYTRHAQANARKMQNLLALFGCTLLVAVGSAFALLLAPGPESDPAPNWQKELWRLQMAAGDEAVSCAHRDKNSKSQQDADYAQAEREYRKAAETGNLMGSLYDKQVRAEQALLRLYEAKANDASSEAMREKMFNDHLTRELRVYGADGAGNRALPELDNALLLKGVIDPGKLDKKFADDYSHKLIDTARSNFRQKKYANALRYLEEAVSLEEHAHSKSDEVAICAAEFAAGLEATQTDKAQVEKIEDLLRRAQELH